MIKSIELILVVAAAAWAGFVAGCSLTYIALYPSGPSGRAQHIQYALESMGALRLTWVASIMVVPFAIACVLAAIRWPSTQTISN
jgi:hypothetical protein